MGTSQHIWCSMWPSRLLEAAAAAITSNSTISQVEGQSSSRVEESTVPTITISTWGTGASMQPGSNTSSSTQPGNSSKQPAITAQQHNLPRHRHPLAHLRLQRSPSQVTLTVCLKDP